MKEHEIRVKKLNEKKRKFQEELNGVDKQLKDFKIRDKMSEADNYVVTLENISKRLEEFNMEVAKGTNKHKRSLIFYKKVFISFWCVENRNQPRGSHAGHWRSDAVHSDPGDGGGEGALREAVAGRSQVPPILRQVDERAAAGGER